MVLSRMVDSAIYYYDKPVIILSDTSCFSATDIFLAALKGMPNVTIIGTPSGGGSAHSESFHMPGTNLRIRLASMASFQRDGKLFDTHGVIPDVLVEPTPAFFANGDDNVLAAAVEQIAAAVRE